MKILGTILTLLLLPLMVVESASVTVNLPAFGGVNSYRLEVTGGAVTVEGDTLILEKCNDYRYTLTAIAGSGWRVSLPTPNPQKGSFKAHFPGTKHIGTVGFQRLGIDPDDDQCIFAADEAECDATQDDDGVKCVWCSDHHYCSTQSSVCDILTTISAGVTVEVRGEDAGACGEPHFKTWAGKWYDYMGECDLVLLDAPTFHDGLGLTIHLRSKIRYSYSYIETAAVQIGSETVEIASYGDYFLNGVNQAHLPGTITGFPIIHSKADGKEHTFDIQLGNHEMIAIKTFKDFVSVNIKGASLENFGDSVGMMGHFGTGQMLARDGQTLLEDPNAFGQEWQVQPNEPKLFQASRWPQFPDTCILPDETTAKHQRRLGEKRVSKEEAGIACAHWGEGQEMQSCVYDVMATGDIEMAQAGYYFG